MSLHTYAKRHEQVDAFFDRQSTYALDDVSLGRFLNCDPGRAESSGAVPLEELQERLELVKQIQNRVFGKLHGYATRDKMEKRQFTAFQLSVMMMMPLENLRDLKPTLASFKEFEVLIAIFLQRTLPDQPGTSAHSSKRTKSVTITTSASRYPSKRKRPTPGSDDDYDPAEAASIQRSAAEATKCLERDFYACRIKLTSNPQKCHIVPFASNATTASLKLLNSVIPVYRLWFLDEDSEMPDLVADSLGCSDKAWNMLCLNSQLHTWWSKSFFGIKCAGITPKEDKVKSTIWLEFHWMSRRSPQNPARKISIDTPAEGAPSRPHTQDTEESASEPHALESKAARFVKGPCVYYGDAAAVNPDSLDLGLVMDFVGPSGRPLLSGHKFQITMTSEDAAKMKAMVDFQWACVNVANMSGAASWPAFTGEDDDDNNEFADARISAWAEETSLASLTEIPSTLGLGADLTGRKDRTGTG